MINEASIIYIIKILTFSLLTFLIINKLKNEFYLIENLKIK